MTNPNVRPQGRLSLTMAPPTAGAFHPAVSLKQYQSPEFLRLPRAEQRRSVSSLSRAALNALILGSNPPGKSICLCQKSALRGSRQIVTAGLLTHLNAQIEGGSR